MKNRIKVILSIALILTQLFGLSRKAGAEVFVDVNQNSNWLGFLNVFNLPAAGGAYQSGTGASIADLRAEFQNSVLTLSPNSIGETSSYWYTPSGGPGAMGNKILEAQLYVELAGSLGGDTLTFHGEVLSNTFVNPYTSIAYIRDFAPDYSSFQMISTPLVNGVFSISLATINDPLRHVQYGFQTTGPDIWITDAPSVGSVQIVAVPEPATAAYLLAAAALAGGAALIRSRRSKSVGR